MSFIEVSRNNGVGTITINRPARFNSLDVETARDLRKAGLQMARDPAVRVVVLRGLPGMFCSGADLKYIRDGGDASDLGYLKAAGESSGYGAIFKEILEYIHSTISEIKRAPKPFLAAVDGIAAAGGLGIALSCDLVFASSRATFEWAYSKTSLTGAESSTFFLPRLIGLRRALEMVLLNVRLDAERAAQMGLITAVFPTEAFDSRVNEIAQTIAAGPTEAYAVAKQLLNDAAGIDRLDHHLDRELVHLAAIADTPAFAEGLAAFFEKRPPDFLLTPQTRDSRPATDTKPADPRPATEHRHA